MENKATKVKKKTKHSFTNKCGENIFTCLEICSINLFSINFIKKNL